MASNNKINVSLEFTPNPNVLKYSVNRLLLKSGVVRLRNREEAHRFSVLAERLFEEAAVMEVAIGRDSITIMKRDDADWDELHRKSATTIENFLSQDVPVITEEAKTELAEKASRGPSEEDKQVEKKVREVLDTQIRPAVQMDGGDIEFVKYEDGIVYVTLQGACRGCPGARMTLKMGVERRLREAIPEISEVVAV